MKAVQIQRTGGAEVLEYVDLPTPTPGPAQVLVKAHAIGVNMPDVMVRAGAFPTPPPLPAILGIEMSGVVVEAGAQARRFKVGQPVYVSARELDQRGGCYAEYIAVAEDALYPVPDGVDLDMVVTLAGYQVAYLLLHAATRGFAYDSVLVQAAAGGIGSAIVELAKSAGKQVIALVGSEEKIATALALGADVALHSRDRELKAKIAAATGGRGVDLILDPVGGAGLAELFDHLAPMGLVVMFGFLDGRPGNLSEPIFRHAFRSPAVRLFSMHTFDLDPEIRRDATVELLRLMQTGAVKPRIHGRLPLSEAAQAHTLLEHRKVSGRLILKP